MNLQLNLMLESEFRSGSNITGKFVMRIFSIGVPAVVACLLILLVFAGRQAKENLAVAREEHRQLTPVYDTVSELREELSEHRRLFRELEGWRQSRLDWYEMLTELQRITPPNMQLTRMTVNETIERLDALPARKKLMLLKGKVVGKDAREEVQSFDRAMKENHVFSSLMSGVDVILLGTSAYQDEPDVCLFDATCIFVPQKIDGSF